MFYLKQINVITGGPLGAEGPGQLPPLPPPLNPALVVRLCCFRLSLGLLHLVVTHSLSNECIKSTNMSFSVLF